MTFADSDTLTLAYHGRPGLADRVAAARDAGELFLPVFVRLEALRGRIEAVLKAATAEDVLRMQDRLADTERFLARFRAIPFDAAAGRHFARLRRVKSLAAIGRGDLLIACIALAHDATLVTRNLKDFRLVPGLKVENWAD